MKAGIAMKTKTIYIFLGSSIVEFKNEREEISNFIHEISSACFEDQHNVRIKPVAINYTDHSMTIGGKQKEINDGMGDCDFCYFIFGSKAGPVTVEELKAAYEAFKIYQVKPRIYVFFREQEGPIDETIEECKKLLDGDYRHYYQTFKDTDTIKLSIILALNSCHVVNDFEIAIKDGDLYLDKRKVDGLDVEKVNSFSVDKDLMQVKNELAKVDEEYYKLRELMATGYSEENEEKFIRVLEKRQELRKKEEGLSKQILDIALRMSKDIANGEMSPRLKEAYRQLEKGNKEECLKILSHAEIEADFLKNEKFLKAQVIIAQNDLRKNADTYIKEELLSATVSLSTVKNDEDLNNIIARLKSTLPRVKEYGVGYDVFIVIATVDIMLVNYQDALDILNDGIAFLKERGLGHSKECAAFEQSKVTIYFIYGNLPAAIECLNNMLKIYDSMNDDDESSVFNSIVNTYVDLAATHFMSGEYDKVLEYADIVLDKAEEMDEALAVIPKIKIYTLLAMIYIINNISEDGLEYIKEAKALIKDAKELQIDQASYFDSYIRLLEVEGHYYIVEGELKKGMALYNKQEKELNEHKDLFKGANYLQTSALMLRDQALMLLNNGFYKESILTYKKLAELPLNENNRQGVGVDLDYAYICFGAMDIIVSTYLNNEDLLEDEEVGDIARDVIKSMSKALEIGEQNYESNPFVIGLHIFKACYGLIAVLDYDDEEVDNIEQLFKYAEKGIYYAKRIENNEDVSLYWQYAILACVIIAYTDMAIDIDEERVDDEIEGAEEALNRHKELIKQYAYEVFDLLEENYAFNPSIFDAPLDILDSIETYDEDLYNELCEKHRDLLAYIEEQEDDDYDADDEEKDEIDEDEDEGEDEE